MESALPPGACAASFFFDDEYFAAASALLAATTVFDEFIGGPHMMMDARTLERRPIQGQATRDAPHGRLPMAELRLAGILAALGVRVLKTSSSGMSSTI